MTKKPINKGCTFWVDVDQEVHYTFNLFVDYDSLSAVYFTDLSWMLLGEVVMRFLGNTAGRILLLINHMSVTIGCSTIISQEYLYFWITLFPWVIMVHNRGILEG